MNKSRKTKILSLFLAVIMSLPLGVFASLGIFADTAAAIEGIATAPVEPTLENTTDAAYFSFTGNDGNSGTSASAMKKTMGSAWSLLPNGGTLVIPVKGFISSDTAMGASNGPIVITAKDPQTGDMYYTDPATANSTQAGMIMLAAQKTLTFKSDVIFQDIAILQRSCSNIANAANFRITDGATMVIGDNVDFLYSTTVNKAVCNSKLTVDADSTLIVKSAGALSYNGSGTIYVDKNLIGNGITADQFNAFTGKLYDLEGNTLCDITGHTYSLEVIEHTYYNVCSSCGHNGGAFTYTEPTVTSTDAYYWAYTGSDSNDGLSASTPVSTTTKVVSLVNNGGTVYVIGKANAGASVLMDMGGTTMFTAVGPDGTDYRGTDYTGATDPQFGALMWGAGSALCTETFMNDTIFKDINIYNRNGNANILAVTNNSTAVFENVVLKTNSSSFPKNTLSIEAGSTVIMKGNNVGTFSKILGNGTLVVDMQIVNSGKLPLASLQEFEGVVMTLDCKEICAFTGGHDYVDNICTICGAVAGAVTTKYYVAAGGTGSGATPDDPAGSIKNGFEIASADPIEVILVDDVEITGAIVCNDNNQNIKLTSIDTDGDGVYPKLIIQSYIVFDNAGYDNTITFENIEICSDREGTVPLFFCYNNFTIGDGVTCTLSGNYTADVAQYPTIFAGYLEAQGTDSVLAKSQNADCTINVASGTWTALIGGNRRYDSAKVVPYNKGNLTMNVSGGHFIGEPDRGISLSATGMNFYEGNIDVNITDGTFDKDIYAVYTVGGYGGATPYSDYGYKGDISIDIVGGSLSGNIYAKYVNPKLAALVRGNISVSISDEVLINSMPMMVDMRGTKSYASENKVTSLTYSDMLADLIEYKYVDVVNGTSTGMDEPERIAFVGDSITQGTGCTNTDLYPYPVQLQGMLNADEYMVGNFGVGASGVLPSTRYWYNDTLQYHLLMEEFEPTTISFALGTNDANAMGGTAGTADDFEQLYYEFIKSYAELPTVNSVFIATPIMRFDHVQHQTRMISLTIPAIRRVAQKLQEDLTTDKVTLIELNAITFDDVLAGNILGTDKLHPNDAGYTIMAQAFYDAIFNGVVGIPDTFEYMDTVYVSNYGTLTGSGASADDPVNDLGVAFSKINRAGGTIIITDEFTIDDAKAYANINTPEDMTGTLTIKGADPSCMLIWTADTFKLNSDVVFDNITLYTLGNTPYIIGQYNDVTFTDTFSTICDGTIDVVFVAGYNAFGNMALTNTSTTSTYDTEKSASSANDVQIKVNGGTFGAIILGNRRMTGTSVVGTYSGNMTVDLFGGAISGRCQTSAPSGALGMNYVTGTITVNFAGIDLQGQFYGAIRTGTLSNVEYDSANNTGSIVINAPASTMENIVENQLTPDDELYATIADFTVNCTTFAGDIDENGSLSNADITMIIRHLNGWTVTGARYSGDMNKDGKVNNRDAVALIVKLSA